MEDRIVRIENKDSYGVKRFFLLSQSIVIHSLCVIMNKDNEVNKRTLLFFFWGVISIRENEL